MELADELVPYVREMGYTHIELLPLTEHPLDGSWGYQIHGYFAPTSRYRLTGRLAIFRRRLPSGWHRRHPRLGPADISRKDGHGFALSSTARAFTNMKIHAWACIRTGAPTFLISGAMKSAPFLLSSAVFWLDSSISTACAWMPSPPCSTSTTPEAGRVDAQRIRRHENLEAIDFLASSTRSFILSFRVSLTLAEDSTAWPSVSRPTYVGGLGFALKWNMGWMNDILAYMSKDPVHRRYHHDHLTFVTALCLHRELHSAVLT